MVDPRKARSSKIKKTTPAIHPSQTTVMPKRIRKEVVNIAKDVIKQARKEEDARLRIKAEYGDLEEQTIKRLNEATDRAIKREGEMREIERQINQLLKTKKASPSEVRKIKNEILEAIKRRKR